MKKEGNQSAPGRGGQRAGAGRPRVPRITATLTPEVLSELEEQAATLNRTPEEHAAAIITQAMTMTRATTPRPAPILAATTNENQGSPERRNGRLPYS